MVKYCKKKTMTKKKKKTEKNLIFKAIFADFSVPDDSTSRAHLPSKAFLPS